MPSNSDYENVNKAIWGGMMTTPLAPLVPIVWGLAKAGGELMPAAGEHIDFSNLGNEMNARGVGWGTQFFDEYVTTGRYPMTENLVMPVQFFVPGSNGTERYNDPDPAFVGNAENLPAWVTSAKIPDSSNPFANGTQWETKWGTKGFILNDEFHLFSDGWELILPVSAVANHQNVPTHFERQVLGAVLVDGQTREPPPSPTAAPKPTIGTNGIALPPRLMSEQMLLAQKQNDGRVDTMNTNTEQAKKLTTAGTTKKKKKSKKRGLVLLAGAGAVFYALAK